jgi:hypothetical protein
MPFDPNTNDNNSVISIDDTPPPPATNISTIPQTLFTFQSADHTHQTESVHSQHEGSSPLPSILKNSSPKQYHNTINHHHYTASPTTQTSQQTETKYLSSLKFLTLNVRGVFTRQQGVTRGYKDGLQPESLADGSWLVKQNQPVSKIETKSETNLRSLYES